VLGLLDPAKVAPAGFAYLKPILARAVSPPTALTPDGFVEREQRRAHHHAVRRDRPPPKRRAYAVDGKCLRGARRPDSSRAFVPSAVRRPPSATVTAPTRSPSSSPCRNTSTPPTPTRAVITVDALRAQRAHARYLVEQRDTHCRRDHRLGS
jgi:hypothetical protein